MSAGPAVEILLFIITGDSLCCGNERERIGLGYLNGEMTWPC